MNEKAKEKTKEFLKPTKGKIVIMAILIIIAINYFTTTIFIPDGGPNLLYYDPLYWFVALPILFFGTTGIYRVNAFVMGMVMLVLQAIYWYILSCLIIYIIDKIRRRPK